METTIVKNGSKASNISRLLLVSFLFSLLVHFALALFAVKYPLSSEELADKKEEMVDVKILSPEDSRSIVENMRGQLVDLVDRNESKRPSKDTRYLSDINRTVEKESQAAITGNNPNSSFTSLGGGTRQDILSFKQSEAAKNREMAAESKTNSRALGKTESNEKSGNEKSELNLNPSQEDLSRFFAVAPNNYLPSVEIGNSTLLNTASFAYAGFYVRMKRQMESIWDPQPILYRTSTERRPLYVTSLNIVLNSNGSLENVEIAKSSGVPELDEEAIRTVKLSAPFPNPPKGIMSPDNRIYIPEWNFIIYFGKNPF
jgi:TonB family protein